MKYILSLLMLIPTLALGSDLKELEDTITKPQATTIDLSPSEKFSHTLQAISQARSNRSAASAILSNNLQEMEKLKDYLAKAKNMAKFAQTVDASDVLEKARLQSEYDKLLKKINPIWEKTSSSDVTLMSSGASDTVFQVGEPRPKWIGENELYIPLPINNELAGINNDPEKQSQ